MANHSLWAFLTYSLGANREAARPVADDSFAVDKGAAAPAVIAAGVGEGAGGRVAVGTGPAALTILTTFFLSLKVPALAVGWTAKLLRAF